jgi:hypothetical protein
MREEDNNCLEDIIQEEEEKQEEQSRILDKKFRRLAKGGAFSAIVCALILILPSVVNASTQYYESIEVSELPQERRWFGWIPNDVHLEITGVEENMTLAITFDMSYQHISELVVNGVPYGNLEYPHTIFAVPITSNVHLNFSAYMLWMRIERVDDDGLLNNTYDNTVVKGYTYPEEYQKPNQETGRDEGYRAMVAVPEDSRHMLTINPVADQAVRFMAIDDGSVSNFGVVQGSSVSEVIPAGTDSVKVTTDIPGRFRFEIEWMEPEPVVEHPRYADLEVALGSLSISPSQPREGDLVRVNATIMNSGDEIASDFNVSFYLDLVTPSTRISTQEMSLAAGSQGQANILWNTTGVFGKHVLRVLIDEENEVYEMSEMNHAKRTVTVNGPKLNLDTDKDGLPDFWEQKYGLNHTNPTGNDGANGDPDNDGLKNSDEYSKCTNPMDADTDNDGLLDGDNNRLLKLVLKEFTVKNSYSSASDKYYIMMSEYRNPAGEKFPYVGYRIPTDSSQFFITQPGQTISPGSTLSISYYLNYVPLDVYNLGVEAPIGEFDVFIPRDITGPQQVELRGQYLTLNLEASPLENAFSDPDPLSMDADWDGLLDPVEINYLNARVVDFRGLNTDGDMFWNLIDVDSDNDNADDGKELELYIEQTCMMSSYSIINPTSILECLGEIVEQLFEDGFIDNEGIMNSLQQKLENAKKALENGNEHTAQNILEAFINELEAQGGKHIELESAEELIKKAQGLTSFPEDSTDPLNPDTDGDELLDGDEMFVYHTDPLDADTDDDLLTDGFEVNGWFAYKNVTLDAPFFVNDNEEKLDLTSFQDGSYKATIYGNATARDVTEQNISKALNMSLIGTSNATLDYGADYEPKNLGPKSTKVNVTYNFEFHITGGASYIMFSSNGIIFNLITNFTVNLHYAIFERVGSNPLSDDTDHDGLGDYQEYLYGFSLQCPDTDSDSIWDAAELEFWKRVHSLDISEQIRRAKNQDFDTDRLYDGFEIISNMDPTDPDPDNDGLGDFDELYQYVPMWRQDLNYRIVNNGFFSLTFDILEKDNYMLKLVSEDTLNRTMEHYDADMIEDKDYLADINDEFIQEYSDLTIMKNWMSLQGVTYETNSVITGKNESYGYLSMSDSRYFVSYKKLVPGMHVIQFSLDVDEEFAAAIINFNLFVPGRQGLHPYRADLDRDGLSDKIEVSVGSNPYVKDTDDDGIIDGLEYHDYKTDPVKKDTDGDCLWDGDELGIVDLDDNENVFLSDPTNPDSDFDGLLDGCSVEDRLGELEFNTNPLKWDTDDDTMPDGWEVKYREIPPSAGLKPTVSDADGDVDNDDLDNGQEYTVDTNPLDPDTDDDDLWDGLEVMGVFFRTNVEDGARKNDNYGQLGSSEWIYYKGGDWKRYEFTDAPAETETP